MATIVLLSLGLGRPGRGVPALALVVIVLLVFDPWLSRNYGFALSVLATAGLLVLAGPLTSWLSNWMPAGLAALIALPFAAQLACQPVLLLLTPTMPLYGVPANLLAAPAAPVATIVGLIACVLLPWLPGVAAGLLWLAWLPAAWIVAVARTVADLPGSSLPWAAGPVGILLLIGLTVAGLALLLAAPPAAAPPAAGPGAAGPARRRSRGWRVLAAGLLVTAFGGYVGLQMGAGIGRSMAFPADWQLAACDIGQGDAVVVRDDDRYALIDVGPDAALLTECLDTLGIERIDLLVLTHYDLDHVGGVDAVVGRVGTVLAGPPENSQDEYLHDRLAANGATVHLAAQGDSGTLGRLDWKVLWPKRDSSIMQTGNDGSVTIEFDGRGIRSLFLGDLGEAAQKALQASSALGPVDVVKVAHHGSSDQDSAFYARLQATVGLVSVGADNGYGHPTKNALDALRAAGTTPLRTDRQGLLVVAPGAPSAAGAGALTIWTEKIADR
jgi:competence protein ComEC